MTPTVCQLQLHLDGQQFVSFKNNQRVEQIVNNPMIKKMMLTEFFLMNRTDEDAMNLNLLYKEFPEYFVWSPTYKMWSRRKQRTAIGCIVTCHPSERKRYYHRLLLMNVRGPKSYEDLRTVNGRCYTTFREATEKKGLLHSDNNLIECMSEAVTYQMPYSLRGLFATLLVYCNPFNPKELWEKFEDSMSENFRTIPNAGKKVIQCLVFTHINEILLSMGRNINEFKFISQNITSSRPTNEAKDVHFERNIVPEAFFIDGLGGTGKTFLYRALLAAVRMKGFIALATASSGVATSILLGGRTTHSRFKIPVDIDENFTCNISKQSSLATLIRDSKLIVWDEVSMAKKKMIEAFDKLLKDLMSTNILFGGKNAVIELARNHLTLKVIDAGKKKLYVAKMHLQLGNSSAAYIRTDAVHSRLYADSLGLIHGDIKLYDLAPEEEEERFHKHCYDRTINYGSLFLIISS
ncbi:uncharacterized protein LOC132637377 [Lycium barbarum]|uniref:uncharacterized protein LOC132637377 n=1 Tax=Lycium barbarum TaxID=112863 RepID=UPI00293F296E|nr:uncharacterized protein LOC132637377 [Lycium barbarum]